MPKIIFLVTKDDIGGAQKYVKDLADSFNSAKFAVKVLTGGKNGVRFLSNAFYPHFLFINDLAALVELFFIFRREKPDIIHLNSSKAGVVGSLVASLYKLYLKILDPKSRIPNPRVIFTAHGWVFNPDNDLNFLKRRFYVWLHKIAARFQDKIINVSEYDRKLALKNKIASPEKLVTVYNGIDYQTLKFFDKTTARKFLINNLPPKSLILNSEYKWIGSIGRLVIEKDYKTFIETALRVRNAYFFIIGGGPERKDLEARIRNLGLQERFFILDNIAPAAPYLKAFDLFVLSSIKEGLPYTMLEAMAAELPIVVTRVGGMTEIIEERGLVMPPREPEELARAINYLLENGQLAEKSAKKTGEFLRDSLTLEKMVQKTADVYRL